MIKKIKSNFYTTKINYIIFKFKFCKSTIHLEIKYPLYSNHTAQNTQYINIAKPISRQTSFESDPNNQSNKKTLFFS